MFNRKKHHDITTTSTSDTHVVKGAGLARGPALVLGTILAAAGLVLFLHAGGTPTGGFPDGDARGSKFLGFEANGWTAFFTTTAGVILLFAAAQHLLAKLLGLGVGLALAACVVLDLVNGPGVLGLAAANWATDLGWAIAAALLLLNVFAPRIKHEEPVAQHGRLDQDTTRVRTAPPATPTTTTSDVPHRDHRNDRDAVASDGAERPRNGNDARTGTGPAGGSTRID
ncbi:unannotated protein [freshwater metagenome]|uniref:Unannotated protein n=1 Tax=freshwater metagenome TaxID=449393 RepID=A0A6J7FCS6_9ZZZZ|nr:hypothetical protein [Actinomycetota bacterium]